MNLLTPESKILSSLQVALAAAYPLRTVTRSLKDYAERQPAELKAGVFTIITGGQTGEDVYDQRLKLIVVGQVQLGEQAAGEDVEEAELIMAREVKTLIQRQMTGPLMRITNIDHSSQLEVPYGWVSLAVECGPYDATEPLTVDETIGNLTDFLTFRADLDIADPHQSDAEHQKWVQDAPDYSISQPDAQLSVTIPRSTP